MGLEDLLEKLELRHFLYWVTIGAALLFIGFFGKSVIMPRLDAVGSVLNALNWFHNGIIISGFIIVGLFGASVIYYIQIA